MPKAIDTNSMDAGLNDIQTLGNILHICSAQPANYSGIAAVTLGSIALSSGASPSRTA